MEDGEEVEPTPASRVSASPRLAGLPSRPSCACLFYVYSRERCETLTVRHSALDNTWSIKTFRVTSIQTEKSPARSATAIQVVHC